MRRPLPPPPRPHTHTQPSTNHLEKVGKMVKREKVSLSSVRLPAGAAIPTLLRQTPLHIRGGEGGAALGARAGPEARGAGSMRGWLECGGRWAELRVRVARVAAGSWRSLTNPVRTSGRPLNWDGSSLGCANLTPRIWLVKAWPVRAQFPSSSVCPRAVRRPGGPKGS